ncbi:hypothetical protein [Chitinophaga sp.]|uniref:hypothetical protein n=1 Tax=Chitinophaga sp. TaxID=1869181 RepID=UPI002F9493C3
MKEKIWSDPLLQKHIDKRDLVTIYRFFKDNKSILNGFILKKSADYLLLQQIDQFLPNGYVVILRNTIDRIRCNKYDKAQRKILKAEGIVERDDAIEDHIDMSNWLAIFNALRKLDFHVIAECERLPEPAIAIYTIGPIRRISKNQVSVQCYDPAGKLADVNTPIRFEDLTTVTFGDRYSAIFRKYLVAP